MLNCPHHIQWVTEVPGGLHQCILCTRVVTKKDVSPRMEDLPEEFWRRWDAWEAAGQRRSGDEPSPAPRSADRGEPGDEPTPPDARDPRPSAVPRPPISPADASHHA